MSFPKSPKPAVYIKNDSALELLLEKQTFSTHYLKRLFLLSAKFMDDGEPSGKAVTTDESAINGCLENLQGRKEVVT